MKKHIPNCITCLNLLSGCVAVTFALQGNAFVAAICIFLSAVFDFFDGFTARLIHAYSEIGKELDSLADLISFGLAPASLVFSLFMDYPYPECMFGIAPYLPYTAFIIAAFSALRLAKFNLDERQHESFLGMPTPANALLIVGIANAPQLTCLWTTPVWGLIFLFALIIITSILLVCEIPMFSLKTKSKWPLAFVVVSLIAFIIWQWVALAAAMTAYILISVVLWIVAKAKAKKA